MNRKVLLIEPDYKNKYPPMGLMKIATYYRRCRDDVRFYKGDLKLFAAELLCEEFFSELEEKIQYQLAKYYPKLVQTIKSNKSTYLETIPDFIPSDYKKLLKKYQRRFLKEDFPKFDVVGVTTLFTFYWKKTVDTINYAQKFCKENGKMLVGGIAATILPQKMFEDTGIYPHEGLLDECGVLDKGNPDIIDELPLDYSILEEIDYQYPSRDAYFGYMTRGCPRSCTFCAVKKLEPNYKNYIGLANQITYIEKHFGAQKDLLLMDNNVFASNCFEQIIDEIKDCGFAKNAKYQPSNEYEIAINNITAGYNIRGYIRKIIKIYDKLSEKLDEESAGNFYLRRESAGLLYPITATVEEILDLDKFVRPIYAKYYRRLRRARYIDFNQGVDSRLVTDDNMRKLSEVNIRPLRIAFDHYELRDVYIQAVETAARYGINNLSNYLLYNFNDKPEELYYRLKINIDLCEALNVTIYSFPMKYHPIDDPNFFYNRDYVGKYWNRKFIRAVQAILNSTKGKIGRGKSFFEEAFGATVEEFNRLLWMPETFIIYRRRYDKVLRERMAEKYTTHYEDENDLANEWWVKFNQLPSDKLEVIKKIIGENKFKDGEYPAPNDPQIEEVLSYYKIQRDD